MATNNFYFCEGNREYDRANMGEFDGQEDASELETYDSDATVEWIEAEGCQVTGATTDDELAAIVATLEAEAKTEGILLTDASGILTELRDFFRSRCVN